MSPSILFGIRLWVWPTAPTIVQCFLFYWPIILFTIKTVVREITDVIPFLSSLCTRQGGIWTADLWVERACSTFELTHSFETVLSLRHQPKIETPLTPAKEFKKIISTFGGMFDNSTKIFDCCRQSLTWLYHPSFLPPILPVPLFFSQKRSDWQFTV